jgi:hypothetical protein
MSNSTFETSNLWLRRIARRMQKESTWISHIDLELANLPHDVTLNLLRFYIADHARLLQEIADRELELRKVRAHSLASDKKNRRHKIDLDLGPLMRPLRQKWGPFFSIRKISAILQLKK